MTRRSSHFALTATAEQLLGEDTQSAQNAVCRVWETDLEVLLIIAALARTQSATKEEILVLLQEMRPHVIPFRLISVLKTLAQQQLVTSRFAEGATHYSLTPMGKTVVEISIHGAQCVDVLGLV
jgi:hypothetical protein